MKLKHGLHLAYCTNVHPGETWAQTFESLNRWTLSVRERVGGDEYAIGLRLSDQASRDLADPATLLEFQRWLDRHSCYVFTVNGFPFGQFHGGKVKERVYLPDWTSAERLNYTNRLFDLLGQLLPPGMEGSVSTLPGSFKEFIHSPDPLARIQENLWSCVEHIAQLSERTGQVFHLGVEPEPLGLFENTKETLEFFETIRDQHPRDPRLERHLGLNYDTCHFAIQYEQPHEALRQFQSNGIRLSKIHLSNALRLAPSPSALARLAAFSEEVYLHQVVVRDGDGSFVRFKDLPPALAFAQKHPDRVGEEWRVHFHVPLHCQSSGEFETTADHVVGVLHYLREQPALCAHLEMETYTWAVLPEELKTRDVSEQIVSEYEWTLRQMAGCGLVPHDPVFVRG